MLIGECVYMRQWDLHLKVRVGGLAYVLEMWSVSVSVCVGVCS